MSSGYQDAYALWRADPQRFWAEAARGIDWVAPPERVFDADVGRYGRWFVGGLVNACHNAVDRHVANGRADQAALIHDSAMTGEISHLTYGEVLKQINALASVLRDEGLVKGDRVLIYMPNIPEAVIAMLACARLGAIHSVVFGGFAARELAVRIDDAQPKMVIAASCGLEPGRVIAYKPLLDEAIDAADHKVSRCIVLQRPQHPCLLVQDRDLDYASVVEPALRAERTVLCEPMQATDPLYILYTSGTTGKPKGVLRDIGGHIVALKWSIEHEYGVKPGEVYWAASDVGWVVGHSFMVYAPLLHGCTSVIFEGKPVGTPDAGVFWRVISEHKVVALFTAPTAFRAIKAQDPQGSLLHDYDLSSFRTLFLGGERADRATVDWAEKHLGVPTIDNWWQTETGSPIAINPVGLGMLPNKYGSPGPVAPGFTLDILDDEGHAVAPGTLGNIALKLPLPPGCLPTLWSADERFEAAYLTRFPGYYDTSDAGYVDDEGYVFVMARTDDVINVAGHRLSTGAIEEVISLHPEIAECAVVGFVDAIKGHIPYAFVILNAASVAEPDSVGREAAQMVRRDIGAIASLHSVTIVPRLPKTRSGKILRSIIQKILNGENWRVPTTIENPAALDDLLDCVRGRGISVMDAEDAERKDTAPITSRMRL